MLIAFFKPFGVLCQFSGDRPNLSDFVQTPQVYPAGRLDKDSEGLVLLTDDGATQDRIAHPRHGKHKTYWVQVDGLITDLQLEALVRGVQLKDGPAAALSAERCAPPAVPPRDPPIRVRAQIPTSWITLVLNEGRNRQVRRMTAAVGCPTLRLIRGAIGDFNLGDLLPGESRVLDPTPLHSRDAERKPPRHRRHVRRR